MRWARSTRSGRFGRSALARSAEDPRAFHAFYETYAERVVVYFSRRTLDVEVALDLASETFAVALERRRQFRGSTAEEEQGWLFAIARSQLSHYWRRGQVERDALARVGLDPVAAGSGELDRIEELAGLAALRAEVVTALADLPEDQAYAVQQRVVWERPYEELSAELGVSEQVVRARVSRALRALAAVLHHPETAEVG